MSHSLASNTATANIVVALQDQEGRLGYGEGVPRAYVTGEEVGPSLQALRQELAPALMGREAAPQEALGLLESLAGPELLDRFPAAACALETALLDLAGQESGRPLSALLDGDAPGPVTYSAVVPLLEPEPLAWVLSRIKTLGLKQIKIKVDQQVSVERVAQVRAALGPDAHLRVDANGSWQAAEAVELIQAMAPYGVEAVEQPVTKQDLEGLAQVTAQVEPLVLADESLCTLAQAQKLIQRRAVGGFNLRLSKCGGPARTRKLLEMARQAGMACMLGCQVGELGVLSAAGRHFASIHPELIYLEGSLTRFFLPQDIIAQDLTFGPGGQAPPLRGPGLGVQVEKASLRGCEVFALN